MGKTYVVTPNYTTRPPPSLKNVTKSQASDNDDEAESFETPATAINTLFLGDILREPLGMELRVINRSDRFNIPRELLALPPDIKSGFRATRSKLLKGRLGIWATFLATLGLPAGVEAGISLERSSNDMISAAEMETQEMEVNDDFLKQTMDLESVKAYLEGCSDPPPELYVVTGLKIVRGASVTSEKTVAVEASIGAHLASQDVLKVLEFTKARSDGQEFESSTPFVLAFRARKVLYRRGRWEHSLFTKGASMMSTDQQPMDYDVGISSIHVGEEVAPSANSVENTDVLCKDDDEEGARWIIAEVWSN